MVVDPLMIRQKKEKDTDTGVDTGADTGINKGGGTEGGQKKGGLKGDLKDSENIKHINFLLKIVLKG